MLKSSKKGTLSSRVSPSCEKVKEWILSHISQKKLGRGDRVPSERVIGELLGANRSVVRKAVLELVSDGVLKRSEGSGTFVTERGSLRRAIGTRTIGLVLPFVGQDDLGELFGKITRAPLVEPFNRINISADIARGVSSVLKKSGYRQVVYVNYGHEEQALVLDSLVKDDLDGIIVLPAVFPIVAERCENIRCTGLPIVFVDRYFPEIPVDRVATDNFGGVKEAVRYLISHGHRRIAYFTLFLETSSVEDREAGYKAALEDAGIPYDETIVCGPCIVRRGHYSLTRALKSCMDLPEPVTAVFGMNDDMVWGTLEAADELGLSIPKDIEIVGFFDSPIPRGMEVSFGRLVQDKFKIGQMAARLLLERIEGKCSEEPRHVVVPPEFMPVQRN